LADAWLKTPADYHLSILKDRGIRHEPDAITLWEARKSLKDVLRSSANLV